MKKIHFAFISILIILIIGCANSFNNGKEMTMKNCPNSIEPVITDFSMYFLYSRYDSAGTLYWTNSKTYTDDNFYVYSLSKEKGVYKEKDSYRVAYPESNIHCFTLTFYENELPDGFILVHKDYHEYSDLWDCEISKIIANDEIIRVKANDPNTWPSDCIFTETGGKWDSNTNKPDAFSTQKDDTHKYLWVNLNNKLWICLGSVD